MKKILTALALSIALASISTLADDLDQFQGKWSVKKTGDQGAYTQFLEFTKNKWKFKIVGDDKSVVLVAEGTIEIKEAGGVKVAKLGNIRGGSSESDLNDTGDDRTAVYTFRDGKMILATNFDKERDNEKPTLDVYSKAKE